MAKQVYNISAMKNTATKKVTSIGNSVRTAVKNKNKRRMRKKYRGQGK